MEICADLLWTARKLRPHRDFARTRAALEGELGARGNHLAPGGTTAIRPAADVVAHALGGAPAVKGPVIPPKRPAKAAQKPLDDFDDSE